MAILASGSITLATVVDLEGCYRYYLLQSSTLSAPDKPAAYPPGGDWEDTEPTYTSGSTNSLYFVDCNVFSDGTFDYSEVSLSSSYEAAKEAYNAAVNASAAVEKLQESLNSSSGLYCTTEEQDDGSTIYYLHDRPALDDSANVIKLTAETIGFSTDGGETYPYGFTVSGDVIAKLLYAEGINADYISTGALTVKDSDGDILFQADVENESVTVGGWSVGPYSLYAGLTSVSPKDGEGGVYLGTDGICCGTGGSNLVRIQSGSIDGYGYYDDEQTQKYYYYLSAGTGLRIWPVDSDGALDELAAQFGPDCIDLTGNAYIYGNATIDGNGSFSGSLSTYGYSVPRVLHGSVAVSAAANATTQVSVTFSKAFSGTPEVMLTMQHYSTANSYSVRLYNVSSTGFTANVTSGVSSSTNPTLRWVAFYG
ncbi:MAG: H-type lectin domain-containing protein [Clostridiales bacterium]|nr:H-type lectin domain-containing protein [Clostridiales bacterium]